LPKDDADDASPAELAELHLRDMSQPPYPDEAKV
jgi:hypothetical protein